jgi:hypothetical protein
LEQATGSNPPHPEAYAEDGRRDRAIARYEKSLMLNTANTNGVENLRKLRTGS